jgi:hypothetical protein
MSDGTSMQQCAQLLPSAESAIAFARGDAGSFAGILLCTLGRMVVVAPASVLVGMHLGAKPKTALAIAGAAVMSIEVFVLMLAFASRRSNDGKSGQALGRIAYAPRGPCPTPLRQGAFAGRQQRDPK